MNNFARVNKGEQKNSGLSYSPESIGVNVAGKVYGGEVSDFAIAEFIIFNKKLTEYTKVEDYLTEKYKLKYGGDYYGPYSKIWNDTDCINLKNTQSSAEKDCQIQCNNTPDCTVINYHPVSNGCKLKKCDIGK